MGFHFETKRPLAIEINHAGVIQKNGKAPGLVQFFGNAGDSALQYIIDNFTVVSNFGFEGFMYTVLRPGLRQCFQFNIGRVSAFPAIIVPYRRQFNIRKRKIVSDFFEAGFFIFKEVELLQFKTVLRVGSEDGFSRCNDMLDDRIHQELTADVCQFFRRQFPFDDILFSGFDCFDIFDIKVTQTDHYGFFNGVDDAGFISYLNDMNPGAIFLIARRIETIFLSNRVGEEFTADKFQLRFG